MLLGDRYFHETKGLVCDEDGVVYARTYDYFFGEDGSVEAEEIEPKRVGTVEDDYTIPEGLEADYAEILDVWQDAHRGGEAGDLEATYRGQQGFR